MSAQPRPTGPVQLARDAQEVYGRDKPPWCQPWTILSTGCAVVAGVWVVPHGFVRYLVGFPTTFAVLVWWYLFLVIYPQSALRENEQ